ncbi:MAG: gamma-glutamyl-gamma-aminobutyrate hydrolase family protein, partial [Bacillota bacterium]|nr:gamma-glutamyl-gamma-aminobutyrate hydrolase family protein [Bacillota bacterium]
MTQSTAIPRIGIVPLYDETKESYWMLPGYMKGLEEAGAIPLMMPLTDDDSALEHLAEFFDGFLFPGGHDVSPALYHSNPHPKCGAICRLRDTMERKLFDLVMTVDKPAFGICRGIQLFNALLGGTLWQDLPSEHPTNLSHQQKPPYDVPVHEVEVLRNTPLYEILKQDILAVNSYHHQAVKDVAPSLAVSAKATDGIVEGVYRPDKKFIAAVQW